MSTRPTIIFDFGGVLIGWQPLDVYRSHFGGDEKAIERFFAEIDFYNWNLEQDRGRSFAEAVGLLSAQFPQHADLIRLYDEAWYRSLAGVFWPSVKILRDLKQSGYALHGLSNFSVEKFRLVQSRYAFFDMFESILLSAEVGLLKPDARIFEIMLERIGKRPEECIYIDDSAANIETARRLGMQTIHFQSAGMLAERLLALGVAVDHRQPGR